MDLREAVGQLVMPGWREDRPGAGSAGRLRRLLKGCPAGGLIVFRHGDAAQARDFIRRLPRVSGERLLVACDVEEGLAQRFPDEARQPSAMAVGRTGDPDLARRQGRAIGLACRWMGIDLAFAPVVDVNTDPLNPIINVRAFGEDPGQVARMAAAFIRGCQSAGVMACAKHFPGHGATRTDSHSRLPVVRASRASAWRTELAPFRAAVRAGVASVMTAHVAFPAFDGRVPATMSRRLVTGILRRRLGFRGLVVTDALRMGGIAAEYEEGPAAVAALNAGCDILLDPVDPAGLVDHVVGAVHRGEVAEAIVRAAAARVRAAKRRWGCTPVPRKAAWQADDGRVSREIARRAVTLLKGRLPRGLDRAPSRWTVLDDGAAPGAVAGLRAALARDFPKARWAGGAETGVVAVFARVRISKDRIAVPKAKIRRAARALRGCRHVTALLFGSPYVAKDLPKGWAVIAAYSDAPDCIAAVLRAVR